MCTAMTFRNQYFGRTLDFEQSFGERVVMTPQNRVLSFRHLSEQRQHYAILGMASVSEGEPLYYDAMNENGLAMAGLLFSGFASYSSCRKGVQNVASFELIPWILGQCADLREACLLLKNCNVTNENFSETMPATPLHWMIADRERSMVVEAVNDGVKLYENPFGVLTNSPPFNHQLLRLQEYSRLSPDPIEGYSRGLGAVGLPGDWSSSSRFVRGAFVRKYGRCGEGEEECVGHFFRMMQTVAVPKGCMRLSQGDAHTRYTSCCNQDGLIYYYSTYEHPEIIAVPMGELHGNDLRITSCNL